MILWKNIVEQGIEEEEKLFEKHEKTYVSYTLVPPCALFSYLDLD